MHAIRSRLRRLSELDATSADSERLRHHPEAVLAQRAGVAVVARSQARRLAGRRRVATRTAPPKAMLITLKQALTASASLYHGDDAASVHVQKAGRLAIFTQGDESITCAPDGRQTDYPPNPGVARPSTVLQPGALQALTDEAATSALAKASRGV
jgi:hypothetical protein